MTLKVITIFFLFLKFALILKNSIHNNIDRMNFPNKNVAVKVTVVRYWSFFHNEDDGVTLDGARIGQ